MCLTKVYYNTYADGAQDITEKSYPCREGRRCSHPEVRRYDRKFPFTRLADVQAESRRSLSERQPTPYFSSRTPRSAKSSSPPGRRDSGIYMGGGSNPSSKHHDSHDLYAGGYDTYGYRSSSKRHDPRDSLDSRYDRDRDRDRDRELRLKRTVTDPHIVYVDRGRDDGKSSRSRSRSSSRDIPLGLVPVAEEYGRRRRHSISLERDSSDYGYYSGLNYADAAPSRRRTDDPKGYVIYDDDDERRRQRREAKRRTSTSTSTSAYPDEAALPVSMMDPYGSAYVPRRAPAAAVVHHMDGSVSTATGSSSSSSSAAAGRKQLRWEDEVRARREQQNAEIASRPRLSTTTTTSSSGDIKGILKRSASDPWGGKSKSKSKGKAREADDIADLRRAIERMEIPRGRDRQPRARDEWDWSGGGGGYGYGYDDMESGKRSKRSRIYAGDGYRY
ncbi:hypothetical protein L209DRAFT_197528 [Thermothelomyces heterothallicus CBS 203.75]